MSVVERKTAKVTANKIEGGGFSFAEVVTAKYKNDKGKEFTKHKSFTKFDNADFGDLNSTLNQDRPTDNARLEWSKTLEFKFYLFIAVILTLSEALMVGYTAAHWYTGLAQQGPPRLYPNGNQFSNETNNFSNPLFAAQIIVLIFSCIQFVYGIIRVVMHIDDKLFDLTLCQKITDVLLDMEVLFELFCLSVGFAFIFQSSGVAAVRILRPFRLLWYFELFKAKVHNRRKTLLILDPLTSVHLSLLYLERIITEIFTAKSRGGILVILIYFYTTFVMGITFKIEQDKEHVKKLIIILNKGGLPSGSNATLQCSTLTDCFMTFMRFSLYDGNGFDFLTAVAQASPREGTVMFIYLIFASFILLNGLISIFGHSFISQIEYEQEDEDAKAAQEKKGRAVELRKKLREEKKMAKENPVVIQVTDEAERNRSASIIARGLASMPMSPSNKRHRETMAAIEKLQTDMENVNKTLDILLKAKRNKKADKDVYLS